MDNEIIERYVKIFVPKKIFKYERNIEKLLTQIGKKNNFFKNYFFFQLENFISYEYLWEKIKNMIIEFLKLYNL